MNPFAASKPDIGAEHDLVLHFDVSADAQVVAKMGQSQVPWIQGNLANVIKPGNSEKPPDRMVKLPLQQDTIRCTQAIVAETPQSVHAIDIRSAQSRLKIEGHEFSRAGVGCCH